MEPSTSAPGRRRWTGGGRGALVGLVALVVVLSLLAGAAAWWGRPALYAVGLLVDGGQPRLDPSVAQRSSADSSPTPRPDPAPVLPPAEDGTPASAAALAERLADVDRAGVGGRFDLRVDDALTGEVLVSEGTDRASIPASVQKLLTGTAVLRLLGPEQTLSTTVEQRDGVLVLVGGGDPLLTGETQTDYPARGSLQQLAEQTAVSLAGDGVDSIDLAADASLFTGPDWNPDWPEGYRSQVTPVSALVHDQGRTAGVTPGPREQDPARAALDRFAELLAEEGVEVGDVTGVLAPGQDAAEPGEVLAAVSSPPVSVLVQQMLLSSDNDIAETLFRHAAIGAGEPAGFEGGAAALDEVLAGLGVSRDQMRIRDGSGLSRENRLSAPTLTELIGLAVRGEDAPELAPLLTGLPRAGATGSLAGRFTGPGTSAALGEVRAKTGSLRATRSLAGYTRTEDGRLLAFAFMLNEADDDFAAQSWLDRAAAAVSACGC